MRFHAQRLAAAWSLAPAAAGALLLVAPAAGIDETFEKRREEPQSSYTRRWNWCDPGRGPWYSTTRHDTDGEPRLDESRAPDGTYLGVASAEFTGIPPGRYEVWVYYRLSENRSHHVPWHITTDAGEGGARSGFVDQYDPTGDPRGDWFLIAETRADPVPAATRLRLDWSVDTRGEDGFDGRSVSYGGVRIIRKGLVKVAAPQLAPPGGTFPGPVEVTMTTATAGASIRYTTDGNTPTASSPLYASPVTVGATGTVRARAYLDGAEESDVTAADFVVTGGAADEAAEAVAESADAPAESPEEEAEPARPEETPDAQDAERTDAPGDPQGREPLSGMEITSGCGCHVAR